MSAAAIRAVISESAYWSQQLGLLTARLAATAEADTTIPVALSRGLADGCAELLTASAAVAAALNGEPGAATDTDVLYAIPASNLPQRQELRDSESTAELAVGIAASAARLRTITRAAASEAAWSPAMTAGSWRWTATGAAVIGNVTEIMLRTLAARPEQLASASPAGAITATDLCTRPTRRQRRAVAGGRWPRHGMTPPPTPAA